MGPVAAKFSIADRVANAMKHLRTQTRLVGADQVHEQFFIKNRLAQLLGVYRLGLPQQTVQASAQNGTATGFLWAHVPLAVVGKKARLRNILVDSQHSTVLATPSAPRLACSRFTFTGAASGAQLVAGKIDPAYPAAVLDLRTAPTGLTVTLGTVLALAGLTGALTAVGAYSPAPVVMGFADEEDDWNVFGPGDGFVIWQDTAGTTSDTRKINITPVWDEIDVA